MYLDTSVLLKLVVPEPESEFYARMLDGEPVVWSSQITLPEAFSALLRKEREGALSKKARNAAWKQIQAYVAQGSLRLVPMSGSLLDATTEALAACHPMVALRTLDAVHLASFRASRAATLVTNDRVMRRAAEHLGLNLSATPTM